LSGKVNVECGIARRECALENILGTRNTLIVVDEVVGYGETDLVRLSNNLNLAESAEATSPDGVNGLSRDTDCLAHVTEEKGARGVCGLVVNASNLYGIARGIKCALGRHK
jgi:hypothetical protein